MEHYVGCAFLFSGRPDPTWEVGEDLARGLEAMWEELEPADGQMPDAPKLGYRGCTLRSGADTEYATYGGVVTRSVGATREHRRDQRRGFEQALLAGAPQGLLPDGLMVS